MDLSAEEEKNPGLVWRKLGGDVTRAPVRGNLFAVALGNGVQVSICWSWLLMFQTFNMLAHVTIRPWLYYSTIIFLATSGYMNGYAMARVLKIFGRENDWKPVAMVSGIFLPLIILGIIFAIDFFEYMETADEEFPVARALASFIIWSIVGLPLTFVGAARAMAEQATHGFSKRNSNPRTIPEQPTYLSLPFVGTLSGAIIFASFFVVLKYMWKSVWRSEAYAMVGYLVLYTFLLTMVISLLSMIWTFLALRKGDYRW